MAAKEARRRDVLCYRIELSYRLFNGTCRFCELHEVVKAAKSMLEDEVGPLDGPSARTDRGIVSRLPVASEVQELCASAIKMAEDLSASVAKGLLSGDDKCVTVKKDLAFLVFIVMKVCFLQIRFLLRAGFILKMLDLHK